ncbi:MAG: U32 family peptidase [Spirochaetaceae bacterium]|nr:U32 family peptidase [Spirochaetaceae bacterium]MCF7948251.1 U32 family peptidase [Spirochaetia bacterium]MCF7950944.1 U32 family peptidase [Spirochaetaceae bacterium]
MELLSPAGNIEKLHYAYLYGADAAYIGIRSFSLRTRADNFHSEEWRRIEEVKGNRKLYGAMNIFFHNDDLRSLEEQSDYISQYPFDAFIVSDLGAYNVLKRHFPDTPYHLSTQANCINLEAVKIYRDLGFKRVILGRETPLDDIAAIKAAVPEMELEVFVHGAMCLAYSGRCFLSSYMAGRSANQGDCTHSCRWMYRVLEEKQRPGEYFPIIESEEGYTSILSSKDLCMFDYLDQLKAAGVDSIKIEGRMKSLYYTAVVTRSYRKALDQLEDRSRDISPVPQSIIPYRDELFKISRREYSTGFFFGKRDADETTSTSYAREYTFLGTVGRQVEPGWFELHVKNQILVGQEIEFIGPEVLFITDSEYQLYNQHGEAVQQADHGKEYFIRPSVPVEQGYIIRAVT